MSNKNNEEMYLIPTMSYLFAGLGLVVGAIPYAIGGALVGTLGVVACIQNIPKPIERILERCNVKIQDVTPKQVRKQRNDKGTRYILTIPNGMSIKDFEKKKDEIEQALRRDIEISLVNHFASIQTIEKQFKDKYSLDLSNFRYKGMMFLIGVDRVDQEIYLDLTGQDTHTLCVGATGSGKSVALNVLITQMILSQVELSLIDLKAVEFILYRDYKHLKGFAINENGAYKVLEETLQEMNNRYELLLQARCKNYQDYNEKHPYNKIKPRVLFIDEFQALIDNKESKSLLFMLLSKARASNIIIVLSCQSPRHEIIEGRLRDNVKNYLIFKCETNKASEVATGVQGDYRATKLKGEGRGLLKAKGDYIEFQGYYLTDEEIEAHIEPFNSPYKPQEKQRENIVPLTQKKPTEHKTKPKKVIDLDKVNSL